MIYTRTPPDTEGKVLGVRPFQDFLGDPDEKTKGMLILCLHPGKGLARSGLGLGPGPQRSQGCSFWGPDSPPPHHLHAIYSNQF